MWMAHFGTNPNLCNSIFIFNCLLSCMPFLVCVHKDCFISISQNQSPPVTFNSPTTSPYATALPPVPLPCFPVSCFALYPKNNMSAEITVCEGVLWERFPPFHSLYLPFSSYLFLNPLLLWKGSRFIMMFIKLPILNLHLKLQWLKFTLRLTRY